MLIMTIIRSFVCRQRVSVLIGQWPDWHRRATALRQWAAAAMLGHPDHGCPRRFFPHEKLHRSEIYASGGAYMWRSETYHIRFCLSSFSSHINKARQSLCQVTRMCTLHSAARKLWCCSSNQQLNNDNTTAFYKFSQFLYNNWALSTLFYSIYTRTYTHQMVT